MGKASKDHLTVVFIGRYQSGKTLGQEICNGSGSMGMASEDQGCSAKTRQYLKPSKRRRIGQGNILDLKEKAKRKRSKIFRDAKWIAKSVRRDRKEKMPKNRQMIAHRY